MATTRVKKQAPASVVSIDELRARVERLRHEVEDAVETIGKRAVGVLPEGQRKQVDEVVGRLNAVRGDVNKTVDTWRSDLEKRFKVLRGTVDKRVSSVRKQTQTRSKKIVSGVEKDVRKYVAQVFKRLQIPVRTDLELVKRRLTAIERRLTEIEGRRSRAA